MMTYNHKNTSGFTVVEVIVTLAITALFLSLFFQMYLAAEAHRLAVARRVTASDIAYSNLRKITARSTVAASAPCDSSTSGNQNNLMINQSAAGSTISSLISPEPTTGLSGTVDQIITAYYPRGCDPNMPIKIEATTVYGTDSPQERVVHASYIN